MTSRYSKDFLTLTTLVPLTLKKRNSLLTNVTANCDQKPHHTIRSK